MESKKTGKDYFDELFRVSKNQIIWGGNYFQTIIQKDSQCWLVWDKENDNTAFADCELAWTSFNSRTGETPGYPLFAETTGYGSGEGLCGWNCRHSFGPGDPDYNPYRDYDAEKNKLAYDLSQRQRRMEAAIRRERIKALGLKTAADNAPEGSVKDTIRADYEAKIQKLRRMNNEYNEFCEKNDLKRMEERLEVAKWNREAARSAAKVDSKKPHGTTEY